MQCSILLSLKILKPCWTRTPRHWHRCTGCTISTRNTRCHLQWQPYTSPMETTTPETAIPMRCITSSRSLFLGHAWAMPRGNLTVCNPKPYQFLFKQFKACLKKIFMIFVCEYDCACIKPNFPGSFWEENWDDPGVAQGVNSDSMIYYANNEQTWIGICQHISYIIYPIGLVFFLGLPPMHWLFQSMALGLLYIERLQKVRQVQGNSGRVRPSRIAIGMSTFQP